MHAQGANGLQPDGAREQGANGLRQDGERAQDAKGLLRPIVRPRRLEELRREHEAFRRAASAILEELACCSLAGGAGARHACLLVEFDAFARLLRRHFREEEERDVFHTEATTSAATRRWVDATLIAHRAFESRLDALGRRLARSPLEPAFEIELRGLVRDLLEHELSEERLVQRLVFEEPDALDLVS